MTKSESTMFDIFCYVFDMTRSENYLHDVIKIKIALTKLELWHKNKFENNFKLFQVELYTPCSIAAG
jgi:hypothetical protein